MSSYYEATFRPRAALPHEVTLLIPNIFNYGETVPVNVPKADLMNIYMAIFRNQLSESDFVEEADDQQTYAQLTSGGQTIPPQWYVLHVLKQIHLYHSDFQIVTLRTLLMCYLGFLQ